MNIPIKKLNRFKKNKYHHHHLLECLNSKAGVYSFHTSTCLLKVRRGVSALHELKVPNGILIVFFFPELAQSPQNVSVYLLSYTSLPNLNFDIYFTVKSFNIL